MYIRFHFIRTNVLKLKCIIYVDDFFDFYNTWMRLIMFVL